MNIQISMHRAKNNSQNNDYNGYSFNLEERLERIAEICSRRRKYSRADIANKLKVSYFTASSLISKIIQKGVPISLKDMSGIKGSREERDRMIQEGYSLRQMARKFDTSPQAIYDYIIKNKMYDSWIKLRRSK